SAPDSSGQEPHECGHYQPISHQELLLGIEPRTSSLPRTRSTAELQQRSALMSRIRVPGFMFANPCRRIEGRLIGQAGEGNRTLVIGLEDRCSTIELHPRFPTRPVPALVLENV